jgi:hypothetical protein
MPSLDPRFSLILSSFLFGHPSLCFTRGFSTKILFAHSTVLTVLPELYK